MAASWNLPAERPGRDAPDALLERRKAADGFPVTFQEKADVRETSYGGVNCFTCEPPGAAQGTLVHFHGGGYRLGSARFAAGFGSRLAVASGFRVVCAGYRLAPEHPYPAGLHDGAAAYSDVIQRHGPSVLAGDSAGGGLAVAVALAAPAELRPTGLLLISPWLDMTLSATTFDSNADTDQMISHLGLCEGAEMYLQGHGLRDPLVSPLHATDEQLATLPQLQLFASAHEALLGDALAFADRLARVGTAVEAHFVPDVPHVWPTILPDLPQSAAALDAMARFLTSAIQPK